MRKRKGNGGRGSDTLCFLKKVNPTYRYSKPRLGVMTGRREREDMNTALGPWQYAGLCKCEVGTCPEIVATGFRYEPAQPSKQGPRSRGVWWHGWGLVGGDVKTPLSPDPVPLGEGGRGGSGSRVPLPLERQQCRRLSSSRPQPVDISGCPFWAPSGSQKAEGLEEGARVWV